MFIALVPALRHPPEPGTECKKCHNAMAVTASPAQDSAQPLNGFAFAGHLQECPEAVLGLAETKVQVTRCLQLI